MAKTKKRPAPKQGRAAKRSKKPAGKKGARRAGPRSQALPGFEQIRHARLDNLCEAIGEERDRMNTAAIEEKANIQSALQYMTKSSIDIYRHGGIELARIPGADKLRVRKTKEEGDAEVAGEQSGASDEAAGA